MSKRSAKRHSLPRKQASLEVQKNATEGIEEVVYWHTAGIVADSGKTVGTATAVRWKKHLVLLTADHVIAKNADDDLRFVFRPPGTLERSPWWQTSSQQTVSPLPASPIKILHRHQDTKADIAALVVTPTLEEEGKVRFYDLPEATRLPRTIRSSLASIGFPADSFERLSPMAGAITAFALWGNIARPGKNPPRDYRPDSHILLDFVPAEDGRHPGGFSGAGVWYQVSKRKPVIWSPNIALAGLVTHYYRNRHLLLIHRTEKIVSFLKMNLP